MEPERASTVRNAQETARCAGESSDTCQGSSIDERNAGEPATGEPSLRAAGRAGRAGERDGGGVRAGGGGPARLLGHARTPAELGPGVGPGTRLGPATLREVVRRRTAQRGVQLRRPARRGGPG